MDITKMTVIELKATAFDLIVELERVQKNLQVVNAQIAKKTAEEKKPK